jgi:hypothetical protein
MFYLNSDIARDNATIQCLRDMELQELNNNVAQEHYDPNLPKPIFTNSWNNKNVDKMDTCHFMTEQALYNKWIFLYQMFENSFKQKESLFLQISSELIREDFKKSLSNILAFAPETISVGVSDDECVYIYFEKDGISVYFDLFFEPNQKTEVALTIFEKNESKISFTDYLDSSINKLINEFVTEDELSYSLIA